MLYAHPALGFDVRRIAVVVFVAIAILCVLRACSTIASDGVHLEPGELDESGETCHRRTQECSGRY